MLKLRNNKKGFTLMEMLIVVAIIAILVAIAIPTFTSSLDKAKQGADNANVRAAYAEAASKAVLAGEDGRAGSGSATTSVEMQANYDGETSIAGLDPKEIDWKDGDYVTVTVSGSTVKIEGKAKSGGGGTETSGS